jgi:hypothetical protein
VIIINHQTMNYAATRDIIFECDSYILFPKSNANATQRFIKAYVSQDKKVLQDIANLRGNQFTSLVVHKTAPSYLMTPKWVQLF